jgi:hypothetical protein
MPQEVKGESRPVLLSFRKEGKSMSLHAKVRPLASLVGHFTV